jgi:hypothetical protein
LEEKYLNFKKNTCGFSGCREYANFIKFVNGKKKEFDTYIGSALTLEVINKINESNEYKKFNDNLEKYKTEVLSKQKECKCISWF